MYDIVNNNYKQICSFNSRSYPSDVFFNYAAKQLLKLLNYDDNIDYVDFNFAYNAWEPILPCVKNNLNLFLYWLLTKNRQKSETMMNTIS